MNRDVAQKDNLIAQAFADFGTDIYNFVYYRTYRNKGLAEDLTQEVFLKALKYKDKFDDHKGSLKTWLYTIAKNLIIDEYKKQGKFDPQSLEQTVIQPSMEESFDDDLLQEFLLTRINLLSADEQELIILRFINEYELEEICELLNKSYPATKVAIHRAVKKLKNIINQ